MSKVVKPHYPVHRLPGDLQNAVKGAASVNLTLEPDEAGLEPVSLDEIRKRVDTRRKQRGFRPVTVREAVQRVRTLRDEWD